MPSFEGHPLNPGEGLPFFVAGGVLRGPGQLEQFMRIEDPSIAPTITLGGFTRYGNQGFADAFVYDHELQTAGNACQFPNGGPEAILALKEPVKKLHEIGVKTIIQAAYLAHEDPLKVLPETAEIIAEVEPTAIEINPSCPNGVESNGEPHIPAVKKPDVCGEIMGETRSRLGDDTTIGFKDGPHAESIEGPVNQLEIAKLAEAIGQYCDFVTGINTVGNQHFPQFKHTNGRGGMSGPPVRFIAHQHLIYWRHFAPDVAYLSVGGVDTQNAQFEVPLRLRDGALLVGGNQELQRPKNIMDTFVNWAINCAGLIES